MDKQTIQDIREIFIDYVNEAEFYKLVSFLSKLIKDSKETLYIITRKKNGVSLSHDGERYFSIRSNDVNNNLMHFGIVKRINGEKVPSIIVSNNNYFFNILASKNIVYFSSNSFVGKRGVIINRTTINKIFDIMVQEILQNHKHKFFNSYFEGYRKDILRKYPLNKEKREDTGIRKAGENINNHVGNDDDGSEIETERVVLGYIFTFGGIAVGIYGFFSTNFGLILLGLLLVFIGALIVPQRYLDKKEKEENERKQTEDFLLGRNIESTSWLNQDVVTGYKKVIKKGELECPFCHKIVKPKLVKRGGVIESTIKGGIFLLWGVKNIFKKDAYYCPECSMKISDR